jgi:peptidoglycan/xylan/chitin deacetylase (PgdA/CDA1 family)
MLEKKFKKSKRKSQLLASALVGTEALKLVKAFWGPNRLTVLAYHRIADPFAPNFPFYRANVSATPEMFARQMAYVREHFNVINLAQLEAFIEVGQALPPCPLLITFDDGYLDTYQNALPVLRANNFPAVVFLITGRMTDPRPLWWDEVSYYFFHSRQRKVHLPLLGYCDISGRANRAEVSESFIQAIKNIPDIWKVKAIENVRTSLHVEPIPDDIALFMSWDQARKLSENGVQCQGHTVTHPILSRIDHGEVRWQLMQSRFDIERETGQPVTAFAYPNGRPGDYNDTAVGALQEAGYNMAFTYTQGALNADDVRQCHLRIPRLHIGYRDSLEIFAMKVPGMRPIQAQCLLKEA